MIISTEELVRWLSRLPQDRPFCTHDHCPVMEYLWREHMTLISPMEALKANRFVAEAADMLFSKRRGWCLITPRELLQKLGSVWLRADLKAQMRNEARIPRLPRSSCFTTR